ncbi:MAG: GAF and ANTAR domain-containing protein [Marmoricola sp.]
MGAVENFFTDAAGERRRAHTWALVQSQRTGVDGVQPGLQQVCLAAVEGLGLAGAVVSLMTATPEGVVGSEAIAATSDEHARRVDELQFSLGEGPGRDAFRGGQPVLVPDLERAVDRWPGYARAACAAGVLAAFAFPLHVGAARFGVLSFYSSAARMLTDDDVTDCLLFAELATELLLDSPASEPNGANDPRLQNALDFRDEVYQAQGMVMVELGVSLIEALARMRAHAYAAEQDLAALAAEIISGGAHLSLGH